MKRSLAAALAAATLGLGGCGKRGDPLPPLPRTPQAVSVRLAQRGKEVELTLGAPRTTSAGVRLEVMDIETVRADVSGDLAKVGRRERRRAAPGETLVETSPLPSPGTTLRVAARALHKGDPAPLSAVATLTVQPVPPSPHDLQAQLKATTVALAWEGVIPSPPPSPSPTPPPSPGASPRPSPSPSPSSKSAPKAPGPPPAAGDKKGASPSLAAATKPSPSPSASPTPPPRGFWVYRRDPGGKYASPLRAEPLPAPAFEDAAVALGQKWCYVVTTTVSSAPIVESEPSNEACVDVRDIVVPSAPGGVTALVREGAVEVAWSPTTETDVTLYRVYRAVDGGAPERLREMPVAETVFRDPAPPSGHRVQYSVTVVDNAGNESPHSRAAEMLLP